MGLISRVSSRTYRNPKSSLPNLKTNLNYEIMTTVELAYELLITIICIAVVIACIVIGWVLVWKLFLCRFKFIHKLLDWNEEKAKAEHRYERIFQKVLRKRESFLVGKTK